MFDPRVTALEYAVAFFLQEEEHKIIFKGGPFSDADLQKLARLEDLRAELQLHMKEK